MPKDKDLKRRVRARMEKTGESYTAARSHLLRKQSTPIPDGYERLAGKTDEAVAAATGRTWPEWVGALDAIGAAAMSHRDIARRVREQIDSGWWAQTVTVGYERIRGLREIGQRRDGAYEANKSRTIAAPVEELYRAFADFGRRRKWLEEKLTVRGATPHRTVRITWNDGTNVVVGFESKGPKKSVVSLSHGKLPSKQAAEQAKRLWGERFDALQRLLE